MDTDGDGPDGEVRWGNGLDCAPSSEDSRRRVSMLILSERL
jgi:hypothetical protein